jgi:hypothetical protein
MARWLIKQPSARRRRHVVFGGFGQDVRRQPGVIDLSATIDVDCLGSRWLAGVRQGREIRAESR